MELLSVLGIILVLVMVVEFFHIGHLVHQLRETSRVISLQLDQVIKASGVKHPLADRQALAAEIAEAEKKVRKHW